MYTLASVYTVLPFQAVSCTTEVRVHRGYCYAIVCSEEFFTGTAYNIILTSVYTVTLQLHGFRYAIYHKMYHTTSVDLGLHGFTIPCIPRSV